MNRWLKLGLLLVILIAALAGVKATLLRPKPIPVTVYRVSKGLVEDTVTNSRAGTVKTRVRASLSAEYGGRVVKLPVKEGDRVEKDQGLMQLADAELRAEVELRARSVDTAKARQTEACRAAKLARLEFERVWKLYNENIVPQDEVDRRESQRDVREATCLAAKASVHESRAARALASSTLEKSTLRVRRPCCATA